MTRRAAIIAAVRTPIGRYGGALASVGREIIRTHGGQRPPVPTDGRANSGDDGGASGHGGSVERSEE
ncbi:MAG: acetyl-CoA C-acyltransferase, partial [Phycisphaerales bacterium JB038]